MVPISGIVLGGGKSRRMGKDKRQLEINGERFLDRICRLMSHVFEDILVVNSTEDYDCSHLPVRVVTDKVPSKGSLGGLYTGLLEAKYSHGFVVACDMPFLNMDLIKRMCALPPCDILLMKLPIGLQSLHGRYSKKCCPVILEKMTNDDLKIQGLAKDSRLTVQLLNEEFIQDLDPDHVSFLNVNTPADLEFVKKSGLGRL